MPETPTQLVLMMLVVCMVYNLLHDAFARPFVDWTLKKWKDRRATQKAP